MVKFLTILSVLLGIVGVPWGGLVWMAGGMKTVPGLSGEDLQWGLPLPVLAIVVGVFSTVVAWRAVPRRSTSATVSACVVLASLGIVGLLLLTYFDSRLKQG